MQHMAVESSSTVQDQIQRHHWIAEKICNDNFGCYYNLPNWQERPTLPCTNWIHLDLILEGSIWLAGYQSFSKYTKLLLNWQLSSTRVSNIQVMSHTIRIISYDSYYAPFKHKEWTVKMKRFEDFKIWWISWIPKIAFSRMEHAWNWFLNPSSLVLLIFMVSKGIMWFFDIF